MRHRHAEIIHEAKWSESSSQFKKITMVCMVSCSPSLLYQLSTHHDLVHPPVDEKNEAIQRHMRQGSRAWQADWLGTRQRGTLPIRCRGTVVSHWSVPETI